MKFRTTHDVLTDLTAKAAAHSHRNVPVRFTLTGDRLDVCASDGATVVTWHTQVVGIANGTVAVFPTRLAMVLAALGAGGALEVIADDETITIDYGQATARVAPAVSAAHEAPQPILTVDDPVLVDVTAAGEVLHAASTDEHRPHLCGVWVVPDRDGTVTLLASDMYRLARLEGQNLVAPLEAPVHVPREILDLIPTVGVVTAGTRKGGEPWVIGSDPHGLVTVAAPASVPETMPDPTRIVLGDAVGAITVDAEDLVFVLDRLGRADDGAQPVRFSDAGGDAIRVQVTGHDVHVEDRLRGAWTSKAATVACRASYLADAVRAADDRHGRTVTVHLHGKDALGPMVVAGAGPVECWVMPVRIG